ncbi:MAG: hypothetical protein ACXAC6_02415 [Candidatus Hodarchaeales archaeon]
MSNSVNLVGADLINPSYFEDFEDSVFPGWNTTGLWHLEDNNTSSYPMYGLPSDSHYMWYGDNKTGNYNTTVATYGELTSNVFDMVLFNSSSAYLEFWSWAMTEIGEEYDRKQVFISADGGSTWNHLGNITADEDPRWELYTFDISSYTASRSVKVKFAFDSVDTVNNLGRGWVIDDVAIVSEPRGYFDLWINQDNNALVGETHWMDFYADSFFSHDMNVSIKIEIIGPTGNVILHEETNLFFPAYSSWNISKDFTFPLVGYYDVRFSLIDDYPYEWVEWCWWDITTHGDEYFILDIYQDYEAFVGETHWMDFYAESTFNHSMSNVTIKIEVNGPNGEVLYYNESVYIPSYGIWSISRSFTFMYEGSYEVYFYLIDDMDFIWETWCYWEVSLFKEHFELWIDQENFAVVGELEYMGFNIQSYFTHNMTVDVIIEIIDSYGTVNVIYSDYGLYFQAGSSWYLPLGYSFPSSDYYDVHLILIDDIGEYWDTWCWFEVFEYSQEFIWIDIYQDQHAFVGENRWMEFVIYPNVSSTLFDVKIEAWVETPSLGADLLLYYRNETINPNDWWKQDASYTFYEVGYHTVNFRITLANGTSWTHICGWDITPLELEIWIDQANYVKIGEVGEMKLILKNRFPEKTTFGAYLEIKKDGKVMYNFTKNNIVLDPDQEWNEIVAYTFDKLGHWDVYFEVWRSDYSQYWSTDCWWEVQPSDKLVPFIDSDRVAQVNVTEDFFVGVYNYFGDHQDFTVEVVVTHPDGTEDTIFNSSVYELGPGEKWKTPLRYTFNYTGHFTLLVAVNNGGYSGSADSFFDVYVEIDTNTTTTTEPPTRSTTISLTPGFELFLIPLVILPLIVSKKRRR